ncbi:hypothetical protein JKA74_14585 [Marivirga sp. S37H4]|uniref:Translation initiation factor IF-2 N-terminal domain-containing protein n=1 Tax=Marivirga aurantiaca TaxID=2802615 RepID=A0A934X0U3_9BACT|nr:hypothetical protein [Marivirga aurantiaca]MBK6266270.1 hypothetical protein [Marivirga aurantiaca]
MRLAQAARDLSITTEDITSFLAKKGITIEKDSNTKLNDESVTLLFDYFEGDLRVKKKKKETEQLPEPVQESKPELSEEEVDEKESQQPVIEEKSTEIEFSEDINIEATNEPAKETEDTSIHNDITEAAAINSPGEREYKTVSDLLESGDEISDDVVIKAPKVSLQGLNVLGKIDLPAPKAKAEKVEAEIDKKTIRKNDSARRNKREPLKRSRKELTPQQIREREQKREKRRREEAAKLEKKRKEKFYKEKILKPKQEQQKKRKPKKSKTMAPEKAQVQKRPQPTTLIGKFWRWLNT